MCAAWYENPETQWKKLGTYSPTDGVAQPLGFKGKRTIDRWMKQDIKIKIDSPRAEVNTL